MGKIKTIELNESQRKVLEKGYREGKTHSYRMRCKIILLKSERYPSLDVAEQLGCCEVVVNNWLKRYEQQGISGLETKEGRGRKPILDVENDLARVKESVKKHRQRISQAKAELEEALEKNFSQKTLSRYVKKMVVVIRESENVLGKSRIRKNTN